MQWIARGGHMEGGPSAAVAEEFIHKTPPKKRSQFARALMKRRKNRNG